MFSLEAIIPLLSQASLFRPNITFGNPSWDEANSRVLIVRLSPYRDVNRSTPHLFLFQAVRRAVPEAYVDMAFFPPARDRARLEAAGLPLILGTQSRRRLEAFDVVLISNAYTLELINLPYLLLRSGVPLWASERDERYPILLLGGSNAMAVQAIISPQGDSLVDGIFFGEGEREVPRLIRLLHEGAALPKGERLARAARQVRGLWLANGPPDQTVEEAICDNPVGDDLTVDYPLLPGDEADVARLQITYGCPAFCAFCFESFDRKPYREVSMAELLRVAARLKAERGASALDVHSFNFNTHRHIVPLLLELHRRFERVRLRSQRVDLLVAVPGLLEAEVLADKRSYTLGIEGISPRMRAFLHKSLDDAEIEAAMVGLLRHKVREIKLFYILTGHETKADRKALGDFVRWLRAARKQLHPGTRIIFSFGRLIRMPFTPLRYDRLFLEADDWRGLVGSVKSLCEVGGFEFRMATTWEAYATSQVLVMGGYWLHEPIIALARKGHCYDLTLTRGYWTALRRWVEAHGWWNDAFLGEKGADYPFPLAFVRRRVSDAYLYRLYREGVEGRDGGYCLGGAAPEPRLPHAASCAPCGACRTSAQRRAILRHAIRPAEAADLEALASLMERKRQLRPRYARLWLPPHVAGASPAWINAWVTQCLFRAHPHLAEQVLSVREALFSTKAHRRRYVGMYGEAVFAVRAWAPDALAVVEAGWGDDVRFLGWVDDFTPGHFRQMEIVLNLPVVHFPRAGDHLRRYLQAAHLPVNLRREGEGYRLDLSRKALKKRVVLAGHVVMADGSWRLRLTVTPKFDLVDFLRSFPGEDRHREARVEVVRLHFA